MTVEQKDRITALRNSGKSYAEIARELDLGKSTVSRKLRTKENTITAKQDQQLGLLGTVSRRSRNNITHWRTVLDRENEAGCTTPLENQSDKPQVRAEPGVTSWTRLKEKEPL